MECSPDTAWDICRWKVEALQDDAAQAFPLGKKTKVTSMHLTLRTLLLKDDEVQKVQAQLPEITQKFVHLIRASHGLIITFQGMGWGDHGVLWAKVKMGAKPIIAFREILEDSFGLFLTDWRFHAHLTIY